VNGRRPGAAPSRIGTAVLGAGPAGLTAAYTLAVRGEEGAVFEAARVVGGLARTVEVDGYRFDLGGHRFFTKLKPIEALWERLLGDELLTRPRLSRIYFNGDYFSYPLRAADVPKRLGLVESALCVFSYLAAARHRRRQAESFEEWVTIRFGRRLYDVFFRSYTQKVWGIPGSEIRSEWAAQRIKNFSLGRALLSLVGLSRTHVTTLIEEFRYPRLGPGQMWEAFHSRIENSGIPVLLGHRCTGIRHANGEVYSVVVESESTESEYAVENVVTSIPLAELVFALDPPPPPAVLEAARKLRYRDLCLVALMTTEVEPFADNWIYLHDPETRAGRVQNFGAWSSDMVRPGTSCLGVEYFCFQGDEIWEMPERDAVQLAKDELARIGLIDPEQVFGGAKVNVPKAYPMYDADYADAVATIREYLEGFTNLQTCGRNGLHRYNNQDHSMWTAILATLNVLDGIQYDVWSINTEAEYHEEGELVDALLEEEPVQVLETVA
jgi:protoporphyrinogen oxidase